MNESSDYSIEKPAPPYGASEGLAFPDWSGQVAHAPRMPTDDWLNYCRANLSKLRLRPGYAQRRRRNGIPVEFSL